MPISFWIEIIYFSLAFLLISVFSWFYLRGDIYTPVHTDWILVLCLKGYFLVSLFSFLLISAHSRTITTYTIHLQLLLACSVIFIRWILLGTSNQRVMESFYNRSLRCMLLMKQSNLVSHPFRVCWPFFHLGADPVTILLLILELKTF